ncbi:MAG: hypothetical protein JWM20_36 [Patescibacteria group bacterium]|nr:hypothetical protein [Patescibacteria group bacterium]
MDMKKLVTHSQGFHADDVVAYAILKEVLTKRGDTWTLERSRDRAVIDAADIAFDIGEEYDPSRNRYDHHQRGRAGARENGVLYASAGLIWKHFGRELCPDTKTWAAVDRNVIQEFDAGDNGQAYLGGLVFPNSGYTDLAIHIAYFEPTMFEKKTPEILADAFEEASEFARGIIVRAIHNEAALERAFAEATEVYKNSKDKKILIFKKNYERPIWRQMAAYPEPIFIIYLNEKGGRTDDWRVEAVPVSFRNFASRKYAPESWRGLPEESEELRAVTGVPDVRFCHPSGFLFGAKSFEGALKLAKMALAD